MIKRTDSDDPDFHWLVEKLNKDLLDRYGELQVYYNRFNSIDNIPNVVVAYINDKPVGCGCFKQFAENTIEIKRMFVDEDARGKGIASSILCELEKWAAELANTTAVLEMGNKQPEAAILYRKQGYEITPNYGQYIGMEETSICMRKEIA